MLVRPARIIRSLFLAEGICQESESQSWRCLTAKMADGVGAADDLITVVEREDVGTGRYISDSSYRLDPHVLIIVRAVGYDRSYEKMREITDLLDRLTDYDIEMDGETYSIYSVKRTNNIQYLGVDATNRRHIHTIEYDFLIH